MLIHFRTIFVFIFCFFSIGGFSQNEFSNWYFGNKAGMDFGPGNPVFTTDGVTFLGAVPATISDSEGNLLFYSNSQTVWDRSHSIMQNGEDINGGIIASAISIAPMPGDPLRYYLFTTQSDEDSGINRLFYSVIDMSLNNGLGAVTNEKNIMLTENIASKLTVVQHANNMDFWLLSHGLGNADFYAFLISENGVSNSPVISTIGSIHNEPNGGIAYSIFTN